MTWLIAGAAIAAILIRPKQWAEAWWACAGAILLVALGLLPVSAAVTAVGKGSDVYLFLTGMMLLAELARREGVFEWFASVAVKAANGSRTRLFGLVYAVGIVVTVFLSNDATAVVLTPAVYAAVKRARVEPLPYLFACAFIANAASFVLPISNPANLVVYGSKMPPLGAWFGAFLLPAVVAIAVTYIALYLVSRRELAGEMNASGGIHRLRGSGRRAAIGIAIAAVVLVAASATGQDLGLVTCIAAVIAILVANGGVGVVTLAGGVSWSVLPLVAGLFVLVEGLYHAGALAAARDALRFVGSLDRVAGSLAASFGMAALSNLMNNLPAGLLASGALRDSGAAEHIRRAVLIGVDLGPNLSVTGSLATILWLVALRREGENVSGWKFLKAGALVMTPALLLASLLAA